MGKIAKWKLAATNSSRIFGGSIISHTSPEILTKHYFKETSSKHNIWGPLYMPKGEGSGDG